MASHNDIGTCEYEAHKDQPKTWHGEDSEEWLLGDGPEDYLVECDSWSCPHDALEGSDDNYCVFHTNPKEVPEDVEEGELLISAISEAIEAKEGSKARRKAEFVGATFGELTIGELPSDGEDLWLRFDHAVFQGTVKGSSNIHQPICFYDSIWEFSVIFENVTFEQDARFEGATFEQDAEFREARFEEFAGFTGATFEGDSKFRDATFEGAANFLRTTFEDLSGFQGATFEEGAEFREAKFEEFAGFTEATFEEFTRFWDAKFKGGVWFRRVKFKAKVIVTLATFEEGAEFREAKFEEFVGFRMATFNGPAWFAESSFVGAGLAGPTEWPSTTSFENVNFTDADLTDVSLANTDLTGAKFSRATLYGTDFNDAKLDGTIFGEAQINERTNFGQLAPGTDRMAEDQASDATDRNGDDVSTGSDKDTLKGHEGSIDERTDNRVTERPLRVIYDPLGGTNDSANRTENGLVHRFKRMVNRYRYWQTSAWLNESDNHSNEDGGSELESERASPDGGGTRISPHADTHLRKAASSYHSIENLARHNTLPQLQSEAFVRRQEMHRLQYAKKRQFWKWLRASVARITLLYGESPWRVIGASLGVILLFGLVYPLGGFRGAGSGEVIQVSSVNEWIASLPDGIYFSTLTFTTLGFGDFQPAGWGKWLATAETALGATLIALLVFVLGRRAAR